MASPPPPVCFVLGGCGAENRTRVLLPPTATHSGSANQTSALSSHAIPSSVTPRVVASLSTPSPFIPSMSLQMSSVAASPSAPAASTSTTTPILHPCHCTSTGTIVGITIAAASTASILTMLVLLYLLHRNGRFASTNIARPMTAPFPTPKNSSPSSSSIRDTVILISPDRETRPPSIDAAAPRSSDSHYSQDSGRDQKYTSRLRSSVPQLPAIDLSPPLLVPSPSSLASESKLRPSHPSSPPPPAPSRSYMYRDSGSADGWHTSGRTVSRGRIPSVNAIGRFAGSDRRGLPRVIEGDGDADVAAPRRMIPVHPASGRTAALSPLHGRGR